MEDLFVVAVPGARRMGLVGRYSRIVIAGIDRDPGGKTWHIHPIGKGAGRRIVASGLEVERREIAIRGALGASSGRLIRQLLSESVLVGALAGIAGLLAAAASLQGLVQLLPPDTPRLNEISLRWPVFVFAAIASLMTGVVFGLIPALKMASPNLQATFFPSDTLSALPPTIQYRLREASSVLLRDLT